MYNSFAFSAHSLCFAGGHAVFLQKIRIEYAALPCKSASNKIAGCRGLKLDFQSNPQPKGIRMNELPKTEKLPLMESFYTLQGEGFHTGRPAWFIRLGGCDVGCVWCDVKESWNPDAHPKFSIESMVMNALENPGRLAVITGGEPLMHNLDALTDGLKAAGFETNIETSGAYPLSGNWDWICLSPKKFKLPIPEVLAAAHEFKVVVYHRSDIEWMQQFLPQLSPDCKLFLQPEWSKAEDITPLLLDFIKQNPAWRLSLQTHKYLNIP